jgi:hypothetical protein
METDLHALSGIRTHYPSFRAEEDSSCLRASGHSERRQTWLLRPAICQLQLNFWEFDGYRVSVSWQCRSGNRRQLPLSRELVRPRSLLSMCCTDLCGTVTTANVEAIKTHEERPRWRNGKKEKQKFLLEETERVNNVATSSTKESASTPSDTVSWKLGERWGGGGAVHDLVWF